MAHETRLTKSNDFCEGHPAAPAVTLIVLEENCSQRSHTSGPTSTRIGIFIQPVLVQLVAQGALADAEEFGRAIAPGPFIPTATATIATEIVASSSYHGSSLTSARPLSARDTVPIEMFKWRARSRMLDTKDRSLLFVAFP